MPFGLRLIQIGSIANIIIGVIGIALLRFFSLNISWFPNVLTPKTFINWLLPAFASLVALLAISRRNMQLYTLALILAAVSGINMVRVIVTQPGNLLTLLSNLFYLIPYTYFLWYWILAKRYFGGDTTAYLSRIDTITKWFAAFWILLSILLMGVTTWQDIRDKALRRMQAIKYIRLLEGKSYKERLQYCSESVNKSEKDICYFTAFSMTKNRDNIMAQDCNRMSEQAYRFACYIMAGTCDELTDETLRKSCLSLSKIYQKENQ